MLPALPPGLSSAHELLSLSARFACRLSQRCARPLKCQISHPRFEFIPCVSMPRTRVAPQQYSAVIPNPVARFWRTAVRNLLLRYFPRFARNLPEMARSLKFQISHLRLQSPLLYSPRTWCSALFPPRQPHPRVASFRAERGIPLVLWLCHRQNSPACLLA
jgi:hypothetical protein